MRRNGAVIFISPARQRAETFHPSSWSAGSCVLLFIVWLLFYFIFSCQGEHPDRPAAVWTQKPRQPERCSMYFHYYFHSFSIKLGFPGSIERGSDMEQELQKCSIQFSPPIIRLITDCALWIDLNIYLCVLSCLQQEASSQLHNLITHWSACSDVL